MPSSATHFYNLFLEIFAQLNKFCEWPLARHPYISYFKHIHTGYKFNKYIVLQFGPVQIKVPNKLFTNKLDTDKYI